LSRGAWQQSLLDAIGRGQVPASQLDPSRRQRLLSHKNETIRELAAKLFAGATNADRQKVVHDYQAAASLAGDKARGKVLFAKTCAACHRLNGVGFDIGPNLAALANKTPQYLLTEILDPNKNVDSRYTEYVATTKAGRTF